MHRHAAGLVSHLVTWERNKPNQAHQTKAARCLPPYVTKTRSAECDVLSMFRILAFPRKSVAHPHPDGPVVTLHLLP